MRLLFGLSSSLRQAFTLSTASRVRRQPFCESPVPDCSPGGFLSMEECNVTRSGEGPPSAEDAVFTCQPSRQLACVPACPQRRGPAGRFPWHDARQPHHTHRDKMTDWEGLPDSSRMTRSDRSQREAEAADSFGDDGDQFRFKVDAFGPIDLLYVSI